jgi:HD superfamily phosphohydrolase
MIFMSQLEITRRIRENIHGTINVTAFEDLVIAHPMIQRLRRIRQLAFLQYVFPGASHSRFEHSLGVMHLAGVAWQKLQENQKSLRSATQKYDDFSGIERRLNQSQGSHGRLSPTFPVIEDVFADDYPLQALRLAALMHDLGHSPFSHSGEGFMPTWQQMRNASGSYPSYISNYIADRCDELSAKGKNPESVQVRHELYTLLAVERVLSDIYRDHPHIKGPLVTAQDIASIITPEIPPSPGSPLVRHGIYHLCHELVSGEFDVDRMDYLLRDSRECGVVYGIFDESRILNSLAVYWDDEGQSLHLAIQFSGLAAFEDYLRARHSMYLQLYFHKTSVAAEAMIKHIIKMLPGWTLPVDMDAYAAIDEHNMPQILLDAAKERIKDPNTLLDFNNTVKDLMFHRNLWKRAFEVASNTGPSAGVESIDEAATVIAGLGVKWEKVSSRNSLTRFRPRSANEPSKHFLRLIKKDDFQFPRVIPIEDQMSLIDQNSQMHITRLYVENRKDPKTARSTFELVRDELHKLVAKSSYR